MKGTAINIFNDTNYLMARSHAEGVRELYYGREKALATKFGLMLSFKGSLQIALHVRKELEGFSSRHSLSLTLICTSCL